MNFTFIRDLCESKLIPSKTSLKNWNEKKLSELAFLYFLGLRILLATPDKQQWARDYCRKAGEPNDFSQWRSSANDLYVLLYGLEGSKIHITSSTIRHWLRHSATHDDPDDTHGLFTRLDAMFHITNSSFKSLRRIITHWEDADHDEQQNSLDRLIQLIHDRAPSNSEILSELKSIKRIAESASSGATGAANVATVTGGLGAGFAPSETWRGVYGPKKPVVIRRGKAPKKT